MKTVVLHARPKKKRFRFLKGALVVVLATVLTTIAIKASDSYRSEDGALLAGVGHSGPPTHCPSDMVYIPDSQGGFCIDRYEASAGNQCPSTNPVNQFDTERNLHDALCIPASAPGVPPWVNVPQHQALALCAKTGKRLPSNREWYRAALGTPDDAKKELSPCEIDHIGASGAVNTGAKSACVSSYGVHDMVGNVWEWVDGSISDGVYDDRMLPSAGYVIAADMDGVPTETATTSSSSFGDDFFFIEPTEVRGMFRGGFWALGSKVGIYGINAASPTTFIGNAVGFRCAREATE